MKRASAILAVFLAASVAFAAQLPLTRAFGEPYPALFLPGFGNVPQRGDTASAFVYRSYLIGADDSAPTSIPIDELLPPTAVLFTTVIDRNIFEPSVAEDPRTATWLAERVDEVAPGARISAVRFEKVEVTYDLTQKNPDSSAVVETVDIAIGAGR